MIINVQFHRFSAPEGGDIARKWVIRDDLGMTGTKYGCGLAQCGACSVLVDGQIV
jgi:isoquinoline 1-oxidoreductase alpha subunit